jgi:hypothetical protein
MKKLLGIIICKTFLLSILLFSCGKFKIINNGLKNNPKGVFIIHDDFTNLLVTSDPSVSKEKALREAANRVAKSGADFISLCVSLGEVVNYSPTLHGETRIESFPGLRGDPRNQPNEMSSEDIDPYGIALTEIRKRGIPVLAKFRVNDRHHVAGGRDFLASKFWKEHPEWYIGHSERDTNLQPYFEKQSSVGPIAIDIILKDRPRLLDYSIPEVREKRLAIFREVIERYDVVGATLNFMREPYCVSFPDKNARYLTEFVRQCRKIIDEVLGAKGIGTPVLGALLPWDIDFCRSMGMEVDVWITEGLLDYVSPSEGWVTNFNMDIRPWVELAKGTRCAVYPGIVGMIAYKADFCIPSQYKIEGTRVNSAKILSENVRAFAHSFYAEGADGFSSFNLYSAEYAHLFPLSDLITQDQVDTGERSYIYLKEPGYIQWNFLQLRLPANKNESRSFRFLMHEKLNGKNAHLSFKARNLVDVVELSATINGRKIPSRKLSLIPHNASGFLHLQYSFDSDDIRDGNNEITFSLNHHGAEDVIIQEIEIRVLPEV